MASSIMISFNLLAHDPSKDARTAAIKQMKLHEQGGGPPKNTRVTCFREWQKVKPENEYTMFVNMLSQ